MGDGRQEMEYERQKTGDGRWKTGDRKWEEKRQEKGNRREFEEFSAENLAGEFINF